MTQLADSTGPAITPEPTATVGITRRDADRARLEDDRAEQQLAGLRLAVRGLQPADRGRGRRGERVARQAVPVAERVEVRVQLGHVRARRHPGRERARRDRRAVEQQHRLAVDREQALPAPHDLARRRHARERRVLAVDGRLRVRASRAPTAPPRASCSRRARPGSDRPRPSPHRPSPTAGRSRPTARRVAQPPDAPPDPPPPADGACAALLPAQSTLSCWRSAASVARACRQRGGVA